MMKNSILVCLLAFLFFALSSFKKDTSILLPLPLNQHYFGLDAEIYIVYNVLEINHDENAVIKHDTLYYQFNSFEQADAYYDFIFSGKTINGLFFDSTVRVEQEKERNLIAYKRKYEEYAANVGMIRKVYKDLTIMNFDTLNVKSGKEIFMDIVEYGN